MMMIMSCFQVIKRRKGLQTKNIMNMMKRRTMMDSNSINKILINTMRMKRVKLMGSWKKKTLMLMLTLSSLKLTIIS